MKNALMPASIAAATAALLACVSQPAHAQFGVNLLTNGDAEAGPGSNTGDVVASIPGWTPTGSATVVTYGASGGFPTAASPGPANRGLQFFAGGPTTAPGSITQNVDLSFATSAIDAGNATFALSGYLGGFDTQDDNASLTITFVDASAQSVGAATTIGPVSSADRNGTTGLLLRTATDFVPVGARSATAVVNFTRFEGAYNDGYADNLSFAVNGANSAAAPEPSALALLLPALPVAGLVLRRRKANKAASL